MALSVESVEGMKYGDIRDMFSTLTTEPLRPLLLDLVESAWLELAELNTALNLKVNDEPHINHPLIYAPNCVMRWDFAAMSRMPHGAPQDLEGSSILIALIGCCVDSKSMNFPEDKHEYNSSAPIWL